MRSGMLKVILLLLVLVNVIIWPWIFKEYQQINSVTGNEAEAVVEKSSQNIGGKNDFELLMDYLFNNHTQKARELLETKKIDLSQTDKNGYQPLTATAMGSPLLVPQLLELGADPHYINQSDNYNIPPIGLVAANDAYKAEFYPAAVALLKYGADPNAPARYGITPIMAAAKYDGSAEMIQLLVDNGANPNCKDIRGETAIQKAVGERREDRQEVITLLEELMNEETSTDGCPKLPQITKEPLTLLKELGYEKDEANFLYAIETNDIYAVKLFLQVGLDPNVVRDNSSSGLNDLYWAEQYEMIRVLLEAGAEPDTADFHGVIPLMRASADGNLDLVTILLNHGADPYKENKHGWNAIEYAESENQYEVINLLESFGDEEQEADQSYKQAGPPDEELVEEEPIEEEMDIFVIQGGERVKEFSSPEEAIAFAETLEGAEVFSPTAPIWDNKPSTVYQGDTYIKEFASKQEAIQFAQNYENSKVVNSKTGYVEWDNYPKECGRCESSIEEEYNPSGIFE